MRVPELGEIQETLLIPLYGRAVQTRRRNGLIHDPKAVEMVDSLDYDFSRFDGAKSLIGAALRTLQFDAWVADFLRRHPAGTVVEMGTGLNTRFERFDNGTVHWFDLDLPDVMALRRTFFQDTRSTSKRTRFARCSTWSPTGCPAPSRPWRRRAVTSSTGRTTMTSSPRWPRACAGAATTLGRSSRTV